MCDNRSKNEEQKAICRLTVTDRPLHDRRFYGLGVQADGVLYNENNEKAGLTEEDYELVENRLRALRPAVARMFFRVGEICDDLDPNNLNTDSAEYRRNLRMLRVLKGAGTVVNAVLFKPFRIPTARLSNAARCMVRILQHLKHDERCDHIRWLTLYNEPEGAFPHDSELVRRVFPEEKREQNHSWTDYVELNHLAQKELEKMDLYPDIRLAVADTVWGTGMRRERMQLSAEAFEDMDVTYAYHNYNPEDPEFYDDEEPDFYYEGMETEAAEMRQTVGSDAPLMIWEFNLAGAGFGAYFPGVDERGCRVTETSRAGARLVDKIFQAIRGGVDGFCLWCMGDMYYYTDPASLGVMRFGLWRYKYEEWRVRPYAHYYAALCHLLRPGCEFQKIQGLVEPINALAWKNDGMKYVALVNRSGAYHDVSFQNEEFAPEAKQISIAPDDIEPDSEFPLRNATEWAEVDGRRIELAPHELVIRRKNV